MKVLLNEQGYVVSYAFEGDLLDAVEAAEPADLSHFERHFTSYRMRDGSEVSLKMGETLHFLPDAGWHPCL